MSKTAGIARRTYPVVHTLVIIVDMSFIFDIEPQDLETLPSYQSVKDVQVIFNDVEKSVFSEITSKDNLMNFIWLDSREVFEEACARNLLNQEDLIRFRNIYQESEADASRESYVFSSGEKDVLNNPFSGLLKNK